MSGRSCSVTETAQAGIHWFSVPESHGADRVIVCTTDKQEVKRLILTAARFFTLVLRELAVIQVTRVEASLQNSHLSEPPQKNNRPVKTSED